MLYMTCINPKLLGFPGHLWVHGISYGEREQTVKEVLQGSLQKLAEIKIPIDYIAVSQDQAHALTSSDLQLVFQNTKFDLFQVDRTQYIK